jgi:hypothetical protein
MLLDPQFRAILDTLEGGGRCRWYAATLWRPALITGSWR